MDYKQYAKKNPKSKKSKKKRQLYTIPEPFSFERREQKRKKKKTIRQRKLEEMITENEKKKREPYKQRFKANKVPKHVKKQLYKEIMRDNEERRQKVKKNSVAITLQNERPFSFYSRDKNKKKQARPKEDWEIFEFRANPINWAVSIEEQRQKAMEKEALRKEKIARRA